ncbi:MAG: hypothetical protein WKG00_30025 [Polyangiaceae bacterium]
MHRALVVAALLSLCGCQDNEQRAARQGEAARSAVHAACASAAPAPPLTTDAGTLADDESADAASAEHGSCTRRLCEERCAAQAVTAFHRACVTACTADGVCQSDSDCGQGLRCIAVAPVVRRCRPQVTSHPSASASAR